MSLADEVSTRLGALERVDGDGLADLFALAAQAGTTRESAALIAAAQGALAVRTVEHARAHVPHYRDPRRPYRAWAPPVPVVAPDLSALPVLTRATVEAAPGDFVADDVRLRSVCHTNGTTGPPLQIFKSHEEIAFLYAYFSRMFAPLVARGGPRPLSLTFPNVYHGSAVPLPGLGMPLVGGVTDDLLIADAARTLLAEHALPGYEPRVSTVSGLVNHLMVFTAFLLEQGEEPARCGVRSVVASGGFAPPRWRAFLAEAWGCAVTDRFTLTEALGGASRCPRCALFHLDDHLVGEVLDADTRARVEDGVGSLVLTSLHPFVQMQPLIRYDAGDLVRVVRDSDCPLARTLTFAFLGKAKNAVRVGGEWLLFSADVAAALTALPDVRTFAWASNVLSVSDRAIGGLPLMEVSVDERPAGGGPPRVRLRAELHTAPPLHAERSAWLRRELTDRLRAAPGTGLARAMDAGAVDFAVELLGPGTLGEPALKV